MGLGLLFQRSGRDGAEGRGDCSFAELLRLQGTGVTVGACLLLWAHVCYRSAAHYLQTGDTPWCSSIVFPHTYSTM